MFINNYFFTTNKDKLSIRRNQLTNIERETDRQKITQKERRADKNMYY